MIDRAQRVVYGTFRRDWTGLYYCRARYYDPGIAGSPASDLYQLPWTFCAGAARVTETSTARPLWVLRHESANPSHTGGLALQHFAYGL